MIRMFLISLFLLNLTTVFAIKPPPEVEIIDWGEGNGLMFDKGKVYQFNSEMSEHGAGIREITKEIQFAVKNGYYQYDYEKRSRYLLPGDDYMQDFRVPSQEDFKTRYMTYYGLRGKASDTVQPPSDINIASIKTKTFLKENIYGRQFDYASDWLLKKFYKACSCHDFNYDELVPPWVEGASDFGSEEEIIIQFKRPTKGLVILNGYVDVFRPHLYQQNNRLKQISITSKQFSIQFEFQDIPRFTTIHLPQDTSEITVKILSVYPGTKYNDTAISGIIGYVPAKDRKKDVKERYKLK